MNVPWLALVLACIAAGRPMAAFLGVGDVSLVTVVANPAEAANWAAQLQALQSQLTTLEGTLQEAETLRRYAGDPAAAARGSGEVDGFMTLVRSASGDPGSVGVLRAQLQGQMDDSSISRSLGAGGAQISYQGTTAPRDLARYRDWVVDAALVSGLQQGIAADQAAHAEALARLQAAWSRFQQAGTESEKQASLVHIAHVVGETEAMDAHRRALEADLSLSERNRALQDRIQAGADDEEISANVAVVAGKLAAQARSAESARLDALNRVGVQRQSPDYSSLRLWTPP